MSGSSSYLLRQTLGNKHGGYETLGSNETGWPDNTAGWRTIGRQKNTVFGANFGTMCNMVCTWCLDIYFHRPNDTDPTSYAGFWGHIWWAQRFRPITPAEGVHPQKAKLGYSWGVYAYGALVSMIVAPTAGLMSDKTGNVRRRYPFVIVGFVGVTCFVGVPRGQTVLFITFAVVQAFFLFNICLQLVADVVPMRSEVYQWNTWVGHGHRQLVWCRHRTLDLENGVVTTLVQLLLLFVFFIPCISSGEGDWVIKSPSRFDEPLFKQ